MPKRTRDVIGVQRRYAWRLYPTPDQTAVLIQQARMSAELWNALLEMCERRSRNAVQRHGRSVSFHCADCASASSASKIVLCENHKLPSEFDMGYWISAMLAECPEWRALSTWTPRRVAGSLAAAYQAFFRRAKAGAGASSGYPRFKALRHADSIPHRCLSGCAIRKSDRHEQSWTVRLKGVPEEIWARGRIPGVPNEWMDADVHLMAGRWEISAAMAIDERRASCGRTSPVVVRFDVFGGLVVNGEPCIPDGLHHARDLDETLDCLQAEYRTRWPLGKRWSDEEWRDRCEDRDRLSRLGARIARVRNNALHVWSKRLVERASVLTVYRPPVQKITASPRGNYEKHGVNVELVSKLNRNFLSFAPAMAAQMLEYKAREIGIPVQIIEDDRPDLAVGEKLVAAGKAVRKAKRAIMENDNEHNQQRAGGVGRGNRGRNRIGPRSDEPQGRSQARQTGV